MIFFLNFGRSLKFTKMIIHQYDFISHFPEKKQQLPSTLCSIWTKTQLQWRAHLDRVALFRVEKVQCFTFIWKTLNFKNVFLAFKHCIFNVCALSEHILHLWIEYGGCGSCLGTTFQLRVWTFFHEENNVEIYLAASAFRSSEICSVRVHWSHPARLGWDPKSAMHKFPSFCFSNKLQFFTFIWKSLTRVSGKW